MKYVCPVCGSNLIYENRQESSQLLRICANDEIEEIRVRDGDECQVYCEDDCTHDIPPELIDEVRDFVLRSGY